MEAIACRLSSVKKCCVLPGLGGMETVVVVVCDDDVCSRAPPHQIKPRIILVSRRLTVFVIAPNTQHHELHRETSYQPSRHRSMYHLFKGLYLYATSKEGIANLSRSIPSPKTPPNPSLSPQTRNLTSKQNTPSSSSASTTPAKPPSSSKSKPPTPPPPPRRARTSKPSPQSARTCPQSPSRTRRSTSRSGTSAASTRCAACGKATTPRATPSSS